MGKNLCSYCGKKVVYAKGLCKACYCYKQKNGRLERVRNGNPSEKVQAIIKDYYKSLNAVETAKRFHVSRQYVNAVVRRYGEGGHRQYSNDVINVLKKKFPKFSKVALCMIRNREYGIDLSDEAKKYLKEAGAT